MTAKGLLVRWVDKRRKQLWSHTIYILLKTEPLNENIVVMTVLSLFLHQLLCTMISSLIWNFLSHLLQISNVLRIQLLPSSLIVPVTQLFDLLGDNAVKILGSLKLESRRLLTSVLGMRFKKTGMLMKLREPPQGGNEKGSPETIGSNPFQRQWKLLQNGRGGLYSIEWLYIKWTIASSILSGAWICILLHSHFREGWVTFTMTKLPSDTTDTFCLSPLTDLKPVRTR